MDRTRGMGWWVIAEEQMWITAAAEAACVSVAEYLCREAVPAG